MIVARPDAGELAREGGEQAIEAELREVLAQQGWRGPEDEHA